MRSVKKDKFLRQRGNVFQIIIICCSKCGKEILIYQKDGKGFLHRLYLNRILAPENLASLQDTVSSIKDLEPLVCECKNVIGIPMRHREGRLALRLIQGAFKKEKYKGDAR